MSFVKLLSRRETLAPLAALGLATAVSVGIIVTRVIFTHNLRYGFLIWNLFLAWLPVLFALLAREKYRQIQPGERPGGHFLGLAAAWLLFLPNAPYICTDLVHLTSRYFPHFWVDFTIILSCAFIGLVLGFVSLYLMHSMVAQRYGQLAGWLFVAGVAGLSSFGIYLGRFLRLNSWDIIAQPGKLYQGISNVAFGQAHAPQFAFLALFATFLLMAYVMLYALTHLPAALQLAAPPGAPATPARA
jgi:uncharacterized membrane protein